MRMLVVFAFALALVACDNGGPTPDWSRMITQPKLLPYGTTDLTTDGAAMRTPPLGTVPRSRIADPARRLGRDADDTLIDRFPVPITRALLERGQARFAVFCAVCHGPEGDGDSAVARNMQRRRPPSLYEARIAALPTGAIYEAITRGYGFMPSLAEQLSIDDRWATIAYLRTLERARTMPLDRLPPPLASDVRRRLP